MAGSEQAGELVAEPGDVGATGDPVTVGGTVLLAIAVGLTVAGITRYMAPRRAAPSVRAPALPPVTPTPDLPTYDETEETEVVETPRPAPERRPEPTPPREPAAAVEEPVGLVARLRSALGRSRAALQERFDSLFGEPFDESTLEELEETLLVADVGIATTEKLIERVRNEAKEHADDPEKLREALQSGMREMLTAVHEPLEPRDGLWVLLVVGVNGSGKTTTIGKLASRLGKEGRKVLLAAGDTYRAAAVEQLQVWAERAGAGFVSLEEGADPGAVAYTALERAQNEGHDVVIIDTAGRLQTRKPLMEQLGKIRRVIGKAVPDAPHETLLVLDGTMGQNGLSQAKLFDEATPLTGVVVTKLDGTAKGGMVLTIASEMELPIKLIGIGEQLDDLKDFEPDAFVEALG